MMWDGMSKTAEKKASRRMCAGCGRRAESSSLVRLVVGPAPPHVAVDLGRRLQGRGVSVHPTRACIRSALRRGGLAKALKGVGRVGPESIERSIVQQLERRIGGLCSSARRIRRLAVGSQAVHAALSAGQGELLVVASDARGRAAELASMATANGCATVAWGTKATLGEVFSRQEVAVFLLTDRGIAREVLACVARVEALSEGE